MEELKEWINKNMFRSDGALNAKKCRKEWFKKYEKINIYQKICNRTDFLDKYDNLKFSERLWYVLNNISEPVLCGYSECNNKVDFFSVNEGYRYDFCCHSHAQLSEKVQEKIRQTRMKRYGVTHHFKKEKFVNKFRKTVKEKYGVENPSQADEVKEKKRQTCRQNFGVDYSLQSKKVREKGKETLQEKYGVENAMKNNEIKEKSRRTRLNDEFEKKINKDNKLTEEVLLLFDKEDFQGVNRNHQLYCTLCEQKFKGTLDNPRCYNCYPSSNTSKGEKEVYYFLNGLLNCKVKENDWNVLEDMELDVFVPSKNFAVEFNGLYYHSEEYSNKDKKYHLKKMEKCQEENIHLVQIFEDEWKFEKNVVKSKLKYLLDKEFELNFLPQIYLNGSKFVGYVDKRWNIFSDHFQKNGFEHIENISPTKWGVTDKKRLKIFDDNQVKFTLWDCGYSKYIYKN